MSYLMILLPIPISVKKRLAILMESGQKDLLMQVLITEWHMKFMRTRLYQSFYVEVMKTFMNNLKIVRSKCSLETGWKSSCLFFYYSIDKM